MDDQHLRPFHRAHALLIAVVAASGCDSGTRAEPGPADPEHTVSVAVQKDGRSAGSIAPGADLWELCGGGDSALVIASGPGGFVRGECRSRQRLTLALELGERGPRAVLRRSDTVVASAEPVDAVTVRSERAKSTSPPRADLRVELGSGRSHTVTPDELAGLVEPRRARRGVTLAAVLRHVGVDPADVASVVVRGRSDYAVDPSWLSDDGHDLRLRHNRRGQLRFAHQARGSERRRVVSVDVVEIHSNSRGRSVPSKP